jgi:glutaredoxin 2
MIFGYKNINFELITLLNDNEETPIKMIGQKMLPILTSEDGSHLPESLDIIAEIDQSFGERLISKAPMSKELEIWLSEARSFLYPLAMPRWIKVGLEEFKTKEAVGYFTEKKEAYIGPFKEHLEKTEEYIKMAHTHLEKLEGMLKIENDFFLGEKASINDINLFATLRSLSVVKEITYPKAVLSYMKKQEELSGVPLHIDIAV